MSDSEPQSSLANQETFVLPPRSRVFLPMPLNERLKGLAWWFTRLFLFRTSAVLGNRWRRLILRIYGAKLGRNVRLEPSVIVDFPWNLRVGNNSVISRGVILNCMGNIDIGKNVRISQYSHLCAGTHRYQRRDMQIERSPISVGDDVWIAADAFVGPGVVIGPRAVLAARASAFADLEADHVYMGEPARCYGPRDPDAV